MSAVHSVSKYGLQVDGLQVLAMPRGAQLLHVGEHPMSKEPIQLWARVDPAAEVGDRYLRCLETDEEFPATFAGVYVGSVCVYGNLMRHIYDLGEH